MHRGGRWIRRAASGRGRCGCSSPEPTGVSASSSSGSTHATAYDVIATCRDPERRDRAPRAVDRRVRSPVTVTALDVTSEADLDALADVARRRADRHPRRATRRCSAAPVRTFPTSTGTAWSDAFEVNVIGSDRRRVARCGATSPRAPSARSCSCRAGPASRARRRRAARTSTGRARPRSNSRRALPRARPRARRRDRRAREPRSRADAASAARNAPMTPAESVARRCARVIAGLTAADAGKFLHFDGTELDRSRSPAARVRRHVGRPAREVDAEDLLEARDVVAEVLPELDAVFGRERALRRPARPPWLLNTTRARSSGTKSGRHRRVAARVWYGRTGSAATSSWNSTSSLIAEPLDERLEARGVPAARRRGRTSRTPAGGARARRRRGGSRPGSVRAGCGASSPTARGRSGCAGSRSAARRDDASSCARATSSGW